MRILQFTLVQIAFRHLKVHLTNLHFAVDEMCNNTRLIPKNFSLKLLYPN